MSRYFSKKLEATTTEQTIDVRKLAMLKILNYGNDDVIIEFDGAIDDDSIIIPMRGSLEIPATLVTFHYKAISDVSTVYISGLKHYN